MDFSYVFLKQCVLDFKMVLATNGIPFMLFLNKLQLFVKKKKQMIPFKNKYSLFYNLIIPLYVYKSHRLRQDNLQIYPPHYIGEYSRVIQATTRFLPNETSASLKKREVEFKQFLAKYKKKKFCL